MKAYWENKGIHTRILPRH